MTALIVLAVSGWVVALVLAVVAWRCWRNEQQYRRVMDHLTDLLLPEHARRRRAGELATATRRTPRQRDRHGMHAINGGHQPSG